jgi:hypothetical protein
MLCYAFETAIWGLELILHPENAKVLMNISIVKKCILLELKIANIYNISFKFYHFLGTVQ